VNNPVTSSSKSRKKNPVAAAQRVAGARLPSGGKAPSTTKAAGAGLKVALLGFGTVGRSVAKILASDKSGQFVLTHIFNRNIEKKKAAGLPPHVRWTENIDEVLSSDADVIIEVVGGVRPAGEWVRRALQAGKSVVTANKLLIAESGPELLDLARQKGGHLEFGASVAGGIPAIIAIQEGMAGDRLIKIEGILNGTCNYILTRMESTGASFANALKEAQELGYAEADPSGDVDGYDARAKLLILIQVGLGMRVRTEQIPCWPISAIEAVDFLYARELNCAIRQISIAQKDTTNGLNLVAAVRPALVPLSSIMAHVQGSQNIVVATGQFVGQIALSGYGAGGDPTAVAVVSDLYSIARRRVPAGRAADNTQRLGPSGTALEVPDSLSGEFTVPHYLRFVVRDRPGIVAEVATVLSKYGIGIDALLQKPGYPHSALPFTVTLEACNSAVLERALAEVNRLDFHVQPPLCLPILVS
jgi:homoserine dehydrogenase